MRGVRFFLEYPSPQEKNRRPAKERTHTGNVMAVFIEEKYGPPAGDGGDMVGMFRGNGDGGWSFVVDCVSALYDEPNSPVCGSSASIDYIRTQCVRISEKRAREIHSSLFAYLDSA